MNDMEQRIADGFQDVEGDLTQLSSDLGGFQPVIDSAGRITGYKTTVGADTVFPFSGVLAIGLMGYCHARYYYTDWNSQTYVMDDTRFSGSDRSDNPWQITALQPGDYNCLILKSGRGPGIAYSILRSGTTITGGYIQTNWEGIVHLDAGDILTISISRVADSQEAGGGICMIIT